MQTKNKARPAVDWPERRKQAVQTIRAACTMSPDVGLILGSGLGALADEVDSPVAIPFSDIPFFPASTVAGHSGRLVLGRLDQKNVVIMQGRFHYYEGYSMQEIVFPVRVMRALGIGTLVITNAAGGINKAYSPGDLMVIADFINLMFDNPLIGANDPELGPRFPDMSKALSPALIQTALETADSLNLPIHHGIYVGVQGPYYASTAEGRLTRLLGGDAVGMSTVPEIVAAAHMGIDILGISCITDVDRGPDPEKRESLDHQDVVSVANLASPRLMALIRAILRRI